jgi:hypothetical protein
MCIIRILSISILITVAIHSAVESLTQNIVKVTGLLLKADPQNVAVKTMDKGGNLAIHSAAERQFPSEETLNMLMDAYPEGLEKKDKEGNLPLHSALERGDSMPVSVIRRMLELYPGACQVKDKEGQLPLHCAWQCAKKSFDEAGGDAGCGWARSCQREESASQGVHHSLGLLQQKAGEFHFEALQGCSSCLPAERWRRKSPNPPLP